MPANVYECMFILDTNKVAGDVPAAAQQLHAVLEKHHAEILASRPWEERRLAYAIGKHKKGYYYLIYFRSETKNVAEITADFGLLRDLILRHMVLHIEPQLVETMLALARDEHALIALRTMQPEPAEEAEAAMGEQRRGPRRPVEAGAGGHKD